MIEYSIIIVLMIACVVFPSHAEQVVSVSLSQCVKIYTIVLNVWFFV